MSDSLSAMYDYYEDYKLLCKKFEITPVDISGSRVDHFIILEEFDEKLKGENK